jgi:hypothetical protein
MGITSGKYYWETTVTALEITNGYIFVGVAPSNYKIPSGNDAATTVPGQTPYYGACVYPRGSGYTEFYANSAAAGGTNIYSGFGQTSVGDVIQVAFDADSGKIWFGRNNSWYNSGVPSSGTTPTATLTTTGYTPFIPCNGTYDSTDGLAVNFGQQPFAYTPPTGFLALNTYNLPDSTIVAGNKVMDATLYTGTSAAQNIVNAAGFKPDMVWTKSRNNATYHGITDSVRGISKAVFPNAGDVESSSAGDYVTAFNTNGFGVNTGSVSGLSGYTYVGWQWQAGQGTTSSNTSGSITSTVSVNASAGFSIVTYTGNGSSPATIGHGLGVAPKFVLVKCLSNNESWNVYHSTIAAGYNVRLNATNGLINENNYNTFTSSVLSVNGNDPVNHSAWTYVAYCWAEIAGFSKFGSYTGNGSSDGPFVYTGFRPKFWMVKRTDAASTWFLLDSSRNLYNVEDRPLLPNATDAEFTYTTLDFLSNGFKVRNTGADINASGGNYIYMAFAENPFKNSLAR